MSDKTRRVLGVVTAVVVAGFIALVAASTGGRDGTRPAARDTDGAFIAAMVPHHQSAVAMSEIALQRASHPQLKRLAQDIIDAQTEEMSALRAMHQRIFGASLSSMSGQHGSMAGMSAESPMSPRQLERAAVFDRAFIDAMVPHHQDAIRMARTQLSSGQDPALKEMSRDIINAQSREIRQMRRWRDRWYAN